MLATCLVMLLSQKPAHLSTAGSLMFQPAGSRILINQVGYAPRWPKIGLIFPDLQAGRAGGSIEIISLDRGTISLSLTLSRQPSDSQSQFDFSSLDQPGRYFIRYGKWDSPVFRVDPNVNQALEESLINSFELQRCGVTVRDSSGKIVHSACHLQDGRVNGSTPEKFVKATGGWHDAGDFGKFIASGAPATVRLLNVVEWYEAIRKRTVPSEVWNTGRLLATARVELEWMLTMQRDDGGVYRKLSGKQWPGPVSPESDAQPRYLFGISTEETGKLSGTMALAARLFRKTDRTFADRCLNAAERAWTYLERNPYQVEKGEGDDAGSGPYPSKMYDQEWTCYTDADDRLWAALELFLTTHDPRFENYFATRLSDKQLTPFEWKDMSTQGLIDYYFLGPGLPPSFRDALSQKLRAKAEDLLLRSNTDSYNICLTRFKWGSNKYVAEDGVFFLWAYALSADRRFFRAALSQLNYLLGENAHAKCFVTGFGTNQVLHPHHRLMQACARTLPGFLVGGPTDVAPSGVMQPGLGHVGYVDDDRAYECNEPAIDYNASLLFLLALIEDLGW